MKEKTLSKPRCPKCGEPVGKGGTDRRGNQRWLHTNKQRKVCKWHGTRPVGVESAQHKGIDPAAVKGRIRDLKSAKVKRYVITAAQNATPINEPFFQALEKYCRINRAQLIVVPYRYKNPTSRWSQAAEDDDWWASEVVPYLMHKRVNLNRHLVVLGDISTQPTAESPLQGFETITGACSGILGHPRLQLKTVATPQSKLPKILTTTGACTRKNYIDSKAGKKGEHHHTFGAAVVELDGDHFHIRQINAVKDGSFYDLGTQYYPDATHPYRWVPVEALVMGDTHYEFADRKVMDATFGPDGIVAALRPRVLVWHDIHDFFARNHHHRGDFVVNHVKHHTGTDNVEKALDELCAFIDKVTPKGTTNIFVPSNHPDALGRWVKEADWKTDPVNAGFYLRTAQAMVDEARMTDSGPTTVDPFVLWLKKKLKCADRCVFLARDESFLINGIEVGFHGDRGPNGSRGTLKGFTRVGVKTITGHSHSPGIEGGAYAVGTNSRLRLGYNSGPSSWMHTDCVIYPNGKRSLINIVNGRWRA